MKKVIFALAIAGMFSFAACGNNEQKEEVKAEEQTQEVKEEPKDEAVKEEATAEVAPVDNNAREQAIAEAAEKICNCASGDKAKIQECLKSVISTGYAAYQNDKDFADAVYNKALKCAAEKAATKAIEKGTEKLADEAAKQLKNVKL